MELSLKEVKKKSASASVGFAMLMRPNKAETVVHGSLIWLCACVRTLSDGHGANVTRVTRVHLAFDLFNSWLSTSFGEPLYANRPFPS